MSGNKAKTGPRHGNHPGSNPATHQQITSQLGGLSLGTTTHQQFNYAQVEKFQYATPANLASHAQVAPHTTGGDYYTQHAAHPATTGYDGHGGHPESALGHSAGHSGFGAAAEDPHFKALCKALAAWEKAAKVPPFKVKYPKWGHDPTSKTAGFSSSNGAPKKASAPKPPGQTASARYKCSCGKQYSEKDELNGHLNRNQTHKRTK
ncbi:hypothetical protein N658DRAFT_502183 [Parathielavia hyrcaniae]|uniref:C2H2-type domain-containing protein n=1 Tax=Parathielavia hyrcaniae TaxID=113614 RepID=A0AAN6SWY8_9PEZI|nr:hypothetical protein N658DRAFT_502183 [Parathielavia hyrcaniae]